MIISHKYKYLFVELPLTGSTAINRELRESYDGSDILSKHATYLDFLKQATEEEKKYFVFSSIRNPLDQAVSHYFKFKTDHRNKYSLRRSRSKPIAKNMDLKKFSFIKKNNADFSTFFLKFYKIPYNNWSCLSHKNFEFVIRFESLADDFAKVLELLGIEQVRPLPQINKTAERDKDFFSYYNTPQARKRAKQVFGPFLKEWGYEFPVEWEDTSISWLAQVEFLFFNIFRVFYWKHLRNII